MYYLIFSPPASYQRIPTPSCVRGKHNGFQKSLLIPGLAVTERRGLDSQFWRLRIPRLFMKERPSFFIVIPGVLV